MKHDQPCVEALILDLFGVIISFDNDIVPARLAKHCVDPDDALARLAGLMARREIITGEVTLHDVHRRLVGQHGLTMTYAQLEAAWLEPYSWPMPGMADLIRSSAQDYRLVLLSNVDHYYWQVVKDMHPELQHFSKLLVSCDLGVAKPDPEAFMRASRAAGADPARCLFVDDTTANVEAAQALGFQTHLFRDVPGLRRRVSLFQVDPAAQGGRGEPGGR